MHKNPTILISSFEMHADMIAVTIQFKKIVLNEVKDNQAILEPSYRKKT